MTASESISLRLCDGLILSILLGCEVLIATTGSMIYIYIIYAHAPAESRPNGIYCRLAIRRIRLS